MSGMQKEKTIRDALIENYNNYAEGLDSKNWPLVRSSFADDVLIDYGELSAASGSADVPRRAEDWLGYLQAVINGFDVTRHTITNHRFVITEDEVTCQAYLTADHVIFPDPENSNISPTDDNVTIVGEYTNTYGEFDGQWKIVKSRLVVNYSYGNYGLFEKAAMRLAEKNG